MNPAEKMWAISRCRGALAMWWGRKRTPGLRAASTGSVAALVLLAGCADTTPAQTEGAAAQEEHNQVDVMFAQMMIPHHDDAIAMAQYLAQVEGVDPSVDELAAGIVASQVAENEEMNTWLGERGYPEVESSPGQVDGDALAGESPAQIEGSFLTEMIAHHEHGVDMSRGAADRGESVVMTDLAQGMVDDQSREIELMREMLEQG